jgi:hypothetical protein
MTTKKPLLSIVFFYLQHAVKIIPFLSIIDLCFLTLLSLKLGFFKARLFLHDMFHFAQTIVDKTFRMRSSSVFSWQKRLSIIVQGAGG